MALPAVPGMNPESAAKLQFVARSAELPASELGNFEIPYFGRTIKLAGDRTFANWSINVMNDEDFSVRAMFELWSNAINQMVGNIRQPALNEAYKTDLEVFQYSKDGEVIRSYIFNGAWPYSVGNIGLDWSQPNQIEEFNVTFAYDWWVPGVQASPKLAGGINVYDPGLNSGPI